MKKIFFIPLLLITLLICSCSPNNEEITKTENGELVKIGFRTGEEISFSNRPLKISETGSEDLFAIQFYEAESGKPYAHVLGDDIGLVNVDFKKDQTYKLKMTYIKNGKNIIIEDSEDKWGIPFSTEFTQTQINRTYYSSATKFNNISSAYITAIEDSISVGRYVEIDRYHSVLDDFLITEATEQIEINLKRMVFGVTLTIELLESEVENLRFSVNSTHDHQQVYFIPLTEGKGTLTIPFLTLGFPDLYVEDPLNYGVLEGYNENVHISLGTHENNTRFYDNKVNINRNVMARMDFVQTNAQDGSEGKINFNLQEGELEEIIITLPANK